MKRKQRRKLGRPQNKRMKKSQKKVSSNLLARHTAIKGDRNYKKTMKKYLEYNGKQEKVN